MSYRMHDTGTHERYMEHNETSTIHKMKETYWTTKQAVIKKLGKKEDVHVVASDHELDAKLEVFKAVQNSCMDLLRVIERYQDRLCVIAQEENAMGRYLKSQASLDKTRAGKMMAAVGKSQSFAAQQRLALRVPLIKLYQAVETFRYRAISDTLMTINQMETARTEYRGALLWMRNISEELDPDTYKQLEKFRKVQAQVRKTKSRFDRLKLDVMQKVDLLAASRCNMFSHVLANYQTALLQFWQKTSRTMTAVSESFKGYQYYEFNMLKELVEPSRKLAKEMSHESDTDIAALDSFDPEQLSLDLVKETRKSSNGSLEGGMNGLDDSDDDLINVETDETSQAPGVAVSARNRLIEFDEGDFDDKLLNDTDLSLPMSKHRLHHGDGDQMSRVHDNGSDSLLGDGHRSQGGRDILGEETPSETDDISALIEILNSTEEDDDNFSKEWQDVFGPSTNQIVASESADFMPSSLLDLGSQKSPASPEAVSPPQLSADSTLLPNTQQQSNIHPAKTKKPHKKSQKADMSAWFNLFADLDPLSNPDAIGKKTEDISDQA